MSQTPNIRLRGLRSPGFPTGYLLGRVGQGAGEVQPLSLQHLRRFGLASRGDLAAVRFTDLKDVPHDYTTFAGALPRVKDTEDGLEFTVVLVSATGTISNVEDPTDPQDAATKAYVDSVAGGGVTSFNSRTGAVTLTGVDVTGALGYTPYDAASFATDFATSLGASLIAGSNITIIDNMDGTYTIAATGGGGGGSYAPLVTGAEPPVLVSDGAGHLIMVAYTP